MKELLKACFIFYVMSVAFSSCMKSNSNGNTTSPVLTLPSTNVKRGDPLLISTNVASNNVIIKWSVNPSAITTIVPANNHAVAFFGVSGNYGITANYYSALDTTKP